LANKPQTLARFSGFMQLADFLRSADNTYGLLTSQDSYIYVGHLYLYMIRNACQQTDRVSLVGMISTFVELVEGAAWVCVRRDDYQSLLADHTVFLSGTREAIETMFRCGFMAVSN
jgi:hypothetical protein